MFSEREKTVRYFSTEEARIQVREELRKALPRLEEARYDDLMGVIEDVIRHEDLVI